MGLEEPPCGAIGTWVHHGAHVSSFEVNIFPEHVLPVGSNSSRPISSLASLLACLQDGMATEHVSTHEGWMRQAKLQPITPAYTGNTA